MLCASTGMRPFSTYRYPAVSLRGPMPLTSLVTCGPGLRE